MAWISAATLITWRQIDPWVYPNQLMKLLFHLAVCCLTILTAATDELPKFRFNASSQTEGQAWQRAAREHLFTLLMGQEPPRGPLDPKVLQRIDVPGEAYALEELTLQTSADRTAHVWMARPADPKSKVGAVLALHGHGGTGEQVVRGHGLYWYGRVLARMGYVVIAPDIGQHQLQHGDGSLMGERTWDALRCLDYVLALPEVDPERLAVAGLSLGGETAMYVAALDERVRMTCSSGWLTTVANMKTGHCSCFDFAGLEESFDFSDIFACIAPRMLVCELGEQERAPGGFPVEIGRQAFDNIRGAYSLFNAEPNLTLTIHPGPHVFSGEDFYPKLHTAFGTEHGPATTETAGTLAWMRFADGPESFVGKPYHWLGRTSLLLTFARQPSPGDFLELNWGAKGDWREAELIIQGKPLTVRDGGHWGFRWVRVPLPEGIRGERLEIRIKKGAGLPAFLSEIRLKGRGAVASSEVKSAIHRATLVLTPAKAAEEEAFPAMRPLWDTTVALPTGEANDEPAAASLFRQAEVNGRLANEAFFRCRRFVDGWLAQADPTSGLIPRNLTSSRDFWNGRDSGADNYPFMVLTAAMTDRPLLEGRMLDMLRTETRLTSRLDRLPDDFSFSKQGWRRERLELDAVIFEGAEYVKDGLLPIAEWLGRSPWSERMIGIIDDIWKHASVETPFGSMPTLNLEVAGDLLQANSRLYWFTGEVKYLDWAIRLGDFHLLGTNHPTRDLAKLRLNDHGCEIINGLTELYVAVAAARPEKKQAYQQPLHELFDCILEKGRNEDGLLYSWFNPQTGEHSNDLCDTWGYVYDGFYTLGLIDQNAAYHDAVRQVLGNLDGKYVGSCWGEKNADAFADSIEGAINLLNREPVPSAARWADSQIQMMWAIQKPSGIIEGWHGDGNFARTSLMYALWKGQGVTAEPWRSDLRLGAVRNGGRLYLTATAAEEWKGRLKFDRPRHKVVMQLPLDYPRINQFPEWFVVEENASYRVQLGSESLIQSGAALAEGIPITVAPGEVLTIEVSKQ